MGDDVVELPRDALPLLLDGLRAPPSPAGRRAVAPAPGLPGVLLAVAHEHAGAPQEPEEDDREDEALDVRVVGLHVDDPDRRDEEEQSDHRGAPVELAEHPGDEEEDEEGADEVLDRPAADQERDSHPDERRRHGCREGEAAVEEERERHERHDERGEPPGPAADAEGWIPEQQPLDRTEEASTTAVLSTQRARTKSVSCSTGKP